MSDHVFGQRFSSAIIKGSCSVCQRRVGNRGPRVWQFQDQCPECRSVIIVWPGGSGKTIRALAIANMVQARSIMKRRLNLSPLRCAMCDQTRPNVLVRSAVRGRHGFTHPTRCSRCRALRFSSHRHGVGSKPPVRQQPCISMSSWASLRRRRRSASCSGWRRCNRKHLSPSFNARCLAQLQHSDLAPIGRRMAYMPG